MICTAGAISRPRARPGLTVARPWRWVATAGYVHVMATGPTIGELVKQGLVSDEDIDTAADAYIGDPGTEVADLGPNYRLNLQAAITASIFAKRLLFKSA